jgi:N-acetylglucosamine-6-phosphate deacetylase
MLVVEDGRIAEIETGTGVGTADGAFDCNGLTLMPGFIDVHIHGAMGVDVNAADVAGLFKIAKFLATKGVTTWVPTMVPDSDENYERIISNIDQLMEIQGEEPISQAVGVHYEGVFANQKMCGALRPQYFKTFNGKEVLAELPKLKRGVHMTTFAPEIEGGIELTRELKRQGWIASIGHTKADLGILDKAFEAGAAHLTHFYNAMTGLHHRDVGVVGWALMKPDVTFDIIADGIHVHPTMLEFACRTKTPDLVSLISDAVAPAGLGDGVYDIWGETVTVDGGRTQNERGSIAGSVISMLDALNRMRSLGFSDVETSRMASGNPAKLIGVHDIGSLEIGKRADLVALDGDGNVQLTLIGGRVVFDRRTGGRSA